MKIYTASDVESDSVEVMLSYQELRQMIIALEKFKEEIDLFKIQNKNNKNLGFTHLHLKDCGLLDKNGKSDVVFYLNLDEVQ